MARMKSNDRFPSIVIAIASIAMISIASCGGSGEDEASDEANPSVSNLPPVAAITYSPSTVLPGDTVTLDGTTSSDPDGDDIVAYAWVQSDGTDVELSATDEAQVSFTAPAAGFLSFELVVTDSAGNQSLPAWADVPVQYDQGAGDDDVAADDDVENMTAVFASAASGSDAPSQSGSYRRPTKTIGRAIEIAGAKGLADVFVLAGTYEETVSLASGVNLKGCVASVGYDDGAISYAADNSTTVIQAPAGARQAIDVTGADSVTVDCFTVIGGTDAAKSMGVLIKNSQGIEVTGVSVTTPGAAGSLCRDVSVEGSDGVTVSDSDFQNSGACDDYISISTEASNAIAIQSGTFTMASGGSETYLKAFQDIGSDSVQIANASISDDGSALGDGSQFVGISLDDTTGAIVENNDISVAGTQQTVGVSFQCNDAVVDASVEGNDIKLAEASEVMKGLWIHCLQATSEFDIQRNRIVMKPVTGAETLMKGVGVKTEYRPIVLNMTNNVISMPAVTNDKADKTAVHLSQMGTDSEISAVHNTLLLVGNLGELYAIHSDRTTVQFSTVGNVIFVYGPNDKNAVFSLKDGCDASFCARDIVSNLFNSNFFSSDLPLAYYYNTATSVALAVANECDDDPLLAQCVSGDVDRHGNFMQINLLAPFFDFDAGELLPGHQGLAKNLGPLGTGVDVDVDGNARDDGLPDIGATEYQ